MPPERNGDERGRGTVEEVVEETTDEAGGESRKPPESMSCQFNVLDSKHMETAGAFLLQSIIARGPSRSMSVRSTNVCSVHIPQVSCAVCGIWMSRAK